MEVWVKHETVLSKADKNGISLREHLEEIEKQTGVRPKDLEAPVEFPELVGHIWSAFVALTRTRPVGMAGPLAIPPSEIKCWMEITDTPLAPWEVQAILRLDAVYLEGLRDGED